VQGFELGDQVAGGWRKPQQQRASQICLLSDKPDRHRELQRVGCGLAPARCRRHSSV